MRIRLPKYQVKWLDFMVGTGLFANRSEALSFILLTQLLRLRIEKMPESVRKGFRR